MSDLEGIGAWNCKTHFLQVYNNIIYHHLVISLGCLSCKVEMEWRKGKEGERNTNYMSIEIC